VAARLFGAADRERERTGLVVEPPDRPLLDQAKERVRSQLGDGWDAEYERGRTMSLDEAVELATEMATRLSDDS
jgi:hypothetical protein